MRKANYVNPNNTITTTTKPHNNDINGFYVARTSKKQSLITGDPISTEYYLIKIFEFFPHSHLLSMELVNKMFHNTITNGFQLFYNYTLTLDCGRRLSRLNYKDSKALLLRDNHPRYTHNRPKETIIHENTREIVITTNNRPLKSAPVREALIAISKTKINKIKFRRYQIQDDIHSPALSTRSSTGMGNGLASITEMGMKKKHKKGTLSIVNADVKSTPKSTPISMTLDNAFTPSSYTNSTSQYNSEVSSPSTFTSFSETSPIPDVDGPSSSFEFRGSITNCGMSNSELSAAVSRGSRQDSQFQELLRILSSMHIECLKIDEECVSWTWESLAHALKHFPFLDHLTTMVCFEKNDLPSIQNEQSFLNFVGSLHTMIPQLKSIYCNDDNLMRRILSLSTYRSLGKHLEFVEDYKSQSTDVQPSFNLNGDIAGKGGVKLSAIKLMNAYDECDDKNGQFVRPAAAVFKKLRNELLPLQFIRYQCALSPDNELTGFEFEGSLILEIAPYDTMFITLPTSCYSFRIANIPKFYEIPEDFTVVVPYSNNIRELCLLSIENLKNFRGLRNLKYLEYLVIRKKPKHSADLVKMIERLSQKSPLKCVSVLYRKSRSRKGTTENPREIGFNHQTIDHNTQVNCNTDREQPPSVKKIINVEEIKQKFNLKNHPKVVELIDFYKIPVLPKHLNNIMARSTHSDYHISHAK